MSPGPYKVTLELYALFQNPGRRGQFDVVGRQVVSVLGHGSRVKGWVSGQVQPWSQILPSITLKSLSGARHRWHHPHLLILATAGTPVPQEIWNKVAG